MFLSRLVYYSRSRIGRDPQTLQTEIDRILESARLHNRPSKITGALAFDRTWFVQVLEGGREEITETLSRILVDPRHEDLVLTEVTAISERAFRQWAMTFVDDSGLTQEICTRFSISVPLNPPLMSTASLHGLVRALVETQARAGQIRT
jgi:hypothetical protein